MSVISNAQPLKSVSLRLSQKQFDAADPTIDPEECSPALAEPGRAEAGPDFGKSAPGATPTAEVLAQIIKFAYRERISDLQFQAGRYVYANGGGSTRACEQWGKLPEEILPELLELFYSHRSATVGFDSQADLTGDLWQRLVAERKIDFAAEGKEAGGTLGIGRFRIQAHFSHQGI